MSPFVSLVGWLVVCVYVCLCVFRHLAAHFCALVALWETFFCFSCTLGGPGTALSHLGLHFASLGAHFCMVFVLGGTLALEELVFELCLGARGVYFGVFLRLWGWTLNPFFDFSEKGLEKGLKKKRKRNLRCMYFHWNVKFFQKMQKCVSTAPVRAD